MTLTKGLKINTDYKVSNQLISLASREGIEELSTHSSFHIVSNQLISLASRETAEGKRERADKSFPIN